MEPHCIASFGGLSRPILDVGLQGNKRDAAAIAVRRRRRRVPEEATSVPTLIGLVESHLASPTRTTL